MVRRWLAGLAVCVLITGAAGPWSAMASAARVAWPITYSPRPSGSGGAAGDFNGDGFDDLAIGAPLGGSGNAAKGGSVNVFYGSATGLTRAKSQLLTPAAASADLFGAAVAAGDFNGDGFDDLAVGAPGSAAQTVTVYSGSAAGLQSRYQTFVPTAPDPHPDLFGYSLAAGNFGGDHADDLAVGCPLCYDLIGDEFTGAVYLLDGSRRGLHFEPFDFTFGFDGGPPSLGDFFGFSLAAGQLGHDAYSDLAVGSPGYGYCEGEGFCTGWLGEVDVLYGSPAGLDQDHYQAWDHTTLSAGASHLIGHFGSALAIGNFGKGCVDDLAIGVPDDTGQGAADAGDVVVVYSTCSFTRPTLSATGHQIWTQNSLGAANSAERKDHFGSSLSAGDLGHDNHADLAVGVPHEGLPGTLDTGAVNVIYGSPTGLTSLGNQLWDQNSPGVGDVAESGDGFGSAVSIGKLGRGCRADLAIGAPGEDIGTVKDAGSVTLLYSACGSRVAALSSSGDQVLHRGERGVGGDLGPEQFGSSLGG